MASQLAAIPLNDAAELCLLREESDIDLSNRGLSSKGDKTTAVLLVGVIPYKL